MNKNIWNRLLSIVLTLVLVLSCLPSLVLPVFAAETSGTCGENVTWEFDQATGTLTISGTGAMTDFDDYSDVPWNDWDTDIAHVVISQGVTSVGKYAFTDCTNLESFDLATSVTSIGAYAFQSCTSLKSVTLPSGIVTIGGAAFADCTGLVSIFISNSVTSLDSPHLLFAGCERLAEITVSEANTHFSSEDGVLFDKEKSKLIVYPAHKIRSSYTVPATVKTIERYAFRDNTILEEVTVPASVTSIGIWAFYHCTALKTARIYAQIEELPGAMFSFCPSLANVELPDMLKRICGQAFFGCSSLAEIDIPDGVTEIASYAFRNTGLTSVILPQSLTHLGQYAFEDCSNLQFVHYQGTEGEWNSNVVVDLFNSSLDNLLQFCTDTDANNDHICDTCNHMTPYVDCDTNGVCDVCGKQLVPQFKIEGNKLYVFYHGSYNWEEIGNVADGKSMDSIAKTGSNGNVDTYTILYSDGTSTTFTVTNGKDGADGITPQFKVENSILFVSYDNGSTWTELGSLKGDKGDQGEQGATGNGIASIEKTGTDGLVDTYTITYTDGTKTTFTVTNGAQGIQGIQGEKGDKGDAPIITIQNGNWFVDGIDTGVAATGIKGDTGNGISDISKTTTEGLVDTYTITYTDGTTTTFTVTNGEKGEQGKQGIQGIQGETGKDGHTPVITIVDGYWYIDGVNTNIVAVGTDGEDGVTPQLRINSDSIWEVSYDNGATWESLGISAVGQNGSNGTNGVTPKLRVNSKNIWEVSYDNGATWESLGISAVGTNGTNGTNGKDGVDGKDGITPKLRINDDNIWEVSYDNGQTWESLGVAATGSDGVTPHLRINGDTNTWEVSYDNGETWTSMGVVATGANGKDSNAILPIVISCISLAGMVIMFCIMMADRKKKAYAGS